MADIFHNLYINTAAQQVYEALTSEEGLRGWWTPAATAKPEIGSLADFQFGEKWHDVMEVVHLQPNRLVEWKCVESPDEWIKTRIVFTMEEHDGKTLVRFGHEGWRDETDFFAHCNYHWGYYMHSLKLYCETGKGMPFPKEHIG